MSTYAIDTKVRPRAAWYLVTAAAWLGAAILAFIAWNPVINLAQDGVTTVGTPARISVPSHGLSCRRPRRPITGAAAHSSLARARRRR